MLVGENEAARIGESVDAVDRGDAAERRQQHREGERQLVRLPDRAVLADFFDMYQRALDLLHPRVGDPLDVLPS